MKKLTSVVLSILMVVSLFSCLFTGSVSATEENTSTEPANLIVNGDFESYINNAHNNTAIPAIADRSVVSLFPADKTNGQWYRSTGGISPIYINSKTDFSPNLDSNKAELTDEQKLTTYPTYFGANNQCVVEPGDTEANKNHVLRIVQDCYTQIDEPKDGGTYTLSFKFRLPSAETSLNYIELQYISPKLNLTNGNSIQNQLKNPYSITNPTNAVVTDENGNDVTSNCTFSSQEATNNNSTTDDKSDDYKYQVLRIAFNTALTDNTCWYTAKVTFTTEKNANNNAQPMPYTHTDGKTYTSPIALKLSYGPYEIGEITDFPATGTYDRDIKNYYTTNALYLDDFTMYENVNCFGDAEFLDVNGKVLPNEQAYVSMKTTVDGKDTSEIYEGQTVNATVDYDKTSGAYTFLGWYKDDVLYDKAETITFTATPGETYTPHFGSVNLLGDSGSFENIASETHLRMDTPTTDNPNFPTGNKWGFNVNAGYFGKTWKETIYDKDGISYQQTSYSSIRTDRLVTTQCNVLDNASIAKSGSKFLRFDEAVPVSLGLDNLERHTDYVLSFYLRYSGANTNKINNIGITTTVNISDKTLDSVGMKTSLENAIPNHKIVVAKCNTTELNNVTTDKWQKMTINFNSGKLDKLYLVIRSASGATLNYYIDDMVLVKMTSADVQFLNTKGDDITNKCANEVKPTITDSKKPGHLVANANYDDNAYDFRGWYDGNTFVSADKEFEFVNGKYSTLTAKVVSRNILTYAASFEGYDNGTTLTYADSAADGNGNFPPPTSDKWGTSTEGEYFKDNHFQLSTVKGSCNEPYYSEGATDYSTKMTVIPHSGDSMLRINTHSRSAIRKLTGLTENTDYTLSFYVYDTSVKDYISAVGIADRYNGYRLETATPDTEGNVAIKHRAYTEGWKKVNLSFNSGENTTLYLFISQSASAKFHNQGASFVDDLVCYKDNLTAADLGAESDITYKASNMRSAYGTVTQALRHKFTIKQSLIDMNSALYGSVVEYGSIAVPTSYLDRQELVKDGKYKGKSPAKGVAYTKYGTDDDFQKIFEIEKDTGDITFTAALTGIGKNGDYATAYARSYTVRNYIIFKDSTGKETVVYGATVKGSVFDTMAAILHKYEDAAIPDSKLQADYNTVTSMLTGDVQTAFLDIYPEYAGHFN